MFSQPKILVCTDFSEGSDKALRAAKDLAHRTKGEVHLLHVAEISFYLNVCGYLPELNEQFLNTITDDVVKMMHEQAFRCGVAADVKVVVKNDVLSGVLEDLKELKADIVVIGSKGTSPELNFYLGSNARKICSASPVPVLVVNDETSIERVAALVDADNDAEEVLRKAIDVNQMYDSRLTVISL
ncbi:MAG: universal stress protein, partial [Bacteriovoracia bacterium]